MFQRVCHKLCAQNLVRFISQAPGEINKVLSIAVEPIHIDHVNLNWSFFENIIFWLELFLERLLLEIVMFSLICQHALAHCKTQAAQVFPLRWPLKLLDFLCRCWRKSTVV